jgi:hypothetical protein
MTVGLLAVMLLLLLLLIPVGGGVSAIGTSGCSSLVAIAGLVGFSL